MILLPRLTHFLILVLTIYGQNFMDNVKARSLSPKQILYKAPGSLENSDLDTASSHHYGHPGRVQIKVYRGPEYDNHASHGYWVRQPADHY